MYSAAHCKKIILVATFFSERFEVGMQNSNLNMPN